MTEQVRCAECGMPDDGGSMWGLIHRDPELCPLKKCLSDIPHHEAVRETVEAGVE